MSEVAAIIVLGAIAVIAVVILDGHQVRTVAGEPAHPHRRASTRAVPTSSVRGPSPPPAASPAPSRTAPAPSRDPAPVPTRSASPRSSPSLPRATAENQTPRGANQLAWSEAILAALGAPATSADIESLGYWMQNEAGSPPSGLVGANNPINVSEPGYGGTPMRAEGHGYFLYSYPTPQAGIAATVAYLENGTYGGIVAALRAGSGLGLPSLRPEFLVYSGGGYSTVPDAWGLSQGKPET